MYIYICYAFRADTYAGRVLNQQYIALYEVYICPIKQ